jgi:hypothetical protein
VALIYPAYPAPLFEKDQSTINQIDAALRQRLNFPILNQPQDAAAPIDYFFDTQYHLTKEGAEWRTSWLIDRLKRAWPLRTSPGAINTASGRGT